MWSKSLLNHYLKIENSRKDYFLEPRLKEPRPKPAGSAVQGQHGIYR
jgi:hypothetical protein